MLNFIQSQYRKHLAAKSKPSASDDTALLDPHTHAELHERRLQDAVAILVLSEADKWNRRLTETLSPHHNHLSRRVKHEMRIPSATELARSVLPSNGLPQPGQNCRFIMPLAFREKQKLLSGFSLSSSHEPISVLNFDDGEDFTGRILTALLAAADRGNRPYLEDFLWRLGFVLQERYIQYVEFEAKLGEVVTIEYEVRFRHHEGVRDEIAAWRLAFGWRQNRFSFKSDLHQYAASYHFHFEVPDGYVLKNITLGLGDNESLPNYVFSGAGTPVGHMYVPPRRVENGADAKPIDIFVDCFEAPPGSQGYTAIIGFVMSAILFALMGAFEYGWLIDSEGKLQATGAITLIAGGPAVVASLLPLRTESTSPIRTPLTARLALWASFAMSAFVALALATKGFGLGLDSFEHAQIGYTFLKGWITTAAAAMALMFALRGFGERNFRVMVNWSAILAVIFGMVILQPNPPSASEFFFSAVIPIYTLVWLRCLVGWIKSVYLASGASRRYMQQSVLR